MTDVYVATIQPASRDVSEFRCVENWEGVCSVTVLVLSGFQIPSNCSDLI